MKTTLFLSAILCLVISCKPEGSISNAENGTNGSFASATITKEAFNQNPDKKVGSVQLTRAPYLFAGSAIDTNDSFGPSLNDSKYYDYKEEKLPAITELNDIEYEKGATKLSISGQVIHLGGPTGPFSNLSGRSDIAELHIEATKVIIHSDLVLPSSNIFIAANSIELKGGTVINTTAADYLRGVIEVGQEGRKGLKGGDITLISDNVIYNDDTKIRFIMNGGKGEAGGPGATGINGVDRKVVEGSNYVFQYTSVARDIDRPHDRVPTFDKRTEYTETTLGHRHWPTNGQAAKNAGVSGVGGDGGTLKVSNTDKDFSLKTKSLSGKNGDMIQTVYIGGRGGRPSPAHQRSSYYKGYTLIRHEVQTHHTTAGASSIVPVNEGKGKFGGVKIITDEKVKNLATDNAGLAYELMYLKDSFKIGKIKSIDGESLENKLIQFLEKTKDVKSLNGTSIHTDAMTQYQKISRNLNYFNHTYDWNPAVSLSLAYKLMDKQILNSYKFLYYTKMIENKKKDFKERQAVIEKLVLTLNDINEEHLFQSLEIEKELPALRDGLNKLIPLETQFEELLVKIEAQIREEAQRNVHSQEKKMKLLKSLKVLTAIAKVVPVGQPAVGAIGMGLEAIISAAQERGGLEQVRGIHSAFKTMKNSVMLKESRQNWNQVTDEMDLGDLINMNTAERKKRIKTFYKKMKPVYDEVKTGLAEIKALRAPEGALEKEMEKIKGEHPAFKIATAKLMSILEEKKKLAQQFDKFSSEWETIGSSLNKNFVMINEVLSEDMYIEGKLSLKGLTTLGNMAQAAEERLVYYRYVLRKSFNYTFLEDNTKLSYDLRDIHADVDELVHSNIESNSQVSNDAFETLKTTYIESVNSFTNEIYEIFESGNSIQLKGDHTLELNDSQLEALNNGKSIYLDLYNYNHFPSDRENIRVTSVEVPVDYLEYEGEDEDDVVYALAEVSVKHLGRSVIEKDSRVYSFNRKDLAKRNFYKWGTEVDLITDRVTQIKRDYRLAAFLRDLLNDNLGESNSEELEEYYSRPGGRAQYEVKFKMNTNVKDFSIKLRRALIKINYSYQDKSN